MLTSTLASPAVSEFASAVRAALSDLTPEELDELTDGLEADLTDRLAESAASELGDPAAYAEELRAAAGLPHRPAGRGTGRPIRLEVVEALRSTPREIAAAFRAFGERHPSLRLLRDFVIALRPLWWLFRAAVVTALVVNVLRPGWWMPINGLTVAAGIAALVVSVQFGRGKWLPFAWMRGLLLAANVILAIAAPFVVAGVATAVNNGWYATTYADAAGPDLSSSGLLQNGNQVSNIFAYDAHGDPLTNVQLFDQDGKPLDVMSDAAVSYGYGGDSAYTVPSDAVTGRPGWNVFPLDHVKQNAISRDGTVKATAHRIPAEPPFATVKPLASSETAAAPTPSPTAAPAP